MKKRIVGATALLAITLAGLACGGGSGNSNTSASPSVTAGNAQTPETVLAIEGDAEDAIDMVLAGNWDKVIADADAIDQAWTEFLGSDQADRVTAEQQASMEGAIADLGSASDSRDDLAARQAANDVSKVIVDVFDLFRPTVPTDIGRLDYLERQVIIDTDRGDWAAVENDVGAVNSTFERVRPEVEAVGGDQEATNFAESVSKQKQLATERDGGIVDEANVALELVDSLESVY